MTIQVPNPSTPAPDELPSGASFTSRISAQPKRILVTVSIVALVMIFLLFIWNARELLALIFTSILLATFLRSLSNPLHRKTQIPHGCSLGLVILLLVVLIVGGVSLLYPQLEIQFKQLGETLPRSWLSFQNVLRQYEWGRLLLEQTITWENILREQSILLERVTGIFSSTVSAIISLAIIVFLGFYLAIQPNLYIQGFLHLFPLNNRERMREVMEECGQTLQWWLLGRAISMVSVGTMISIGLGIMGIPLALALGFLAALLDFIPNIGPVVATLPAVIIALGQDPVKALYVLILYFVIQQIENYLITPIIQQRTVDLPPALTIVAQVLLTVILGAFGLLIASPLMAVLIVIVRMLYVEDILGDRFPPPEKKDRWLRIIRLKVSNIRANEKSTPPEADTPN